MNIGSCGPSPGNNCGRQTNSNNNCGNRGGGGGNSSGISDTRSVSNNQARLCIGGGCDKGGSGGSGSSTSRAHSQMTHGGNGGPGQPNHGSSSTYPSNYNNSAAARVQQFESVRINDLNALSQGFQPQIDAAQALINEAQAECQQEHDAYYAVPGATTVEGALANDEFTRLQILHIQHKRNIAYQLVIDTDRHIENLSHEVAALDKARGSTHITEFNEPYYRRAHQLNLDKHRRVLLVQAADTRAEQFSKAVFRKTETANHVVNVRNHLARVKEIEQQKQIQEAARIANEAAKQASDLADKMRFLSTSQQAAKAKEMKVCDTLTCEVGKEVTQITSQVSQNVAFSSSQALAIAGTTTLAPSASLVEGSKVLAELNRLAYLKAGPMVLAGATLFYSKSIGINSDKVPGGKQFKHT
ncbi:hypothetical protein SJI19_17035, partial [Acerihabitans sp. TG2]